MNATWLPDCITSFVDGDVDVELHTLYTPILARSSEPHSNVVCTGECKAARLLDLLLFTSVLALSSHSMAGVGLFSFFPEHCAYVHCCYLQTGCHSSS